MSVGGLRPPLRAPRILRVPNAHVEWNRAFCVNKIVRIVHSAGTKCSRLSEPCILCLRNIYYWALCQARRDKEEKQEQETRVTGVEVDGGGGFIDAFRALQPGRYENKGPINRGFINRGLIGRALLIAALLIGALLIGALLRNHLAARKASVPLHVHVVRQGVYRPNKYRR